MRTAVLMIATVLAGGMGRVANAQCDPDPSWAIRVWHAKSAWVSATNPAPTALALNGRRVDPKKVQKPQVEPARAAAVEASTSEEPVQIKDRMQATAEPKASTNSAPATQITRSGKSNESRKAMLRQRLRELQAQRRWIEEEEYSLRFAVLELEQNAR